MSDSSGGAQLPAAALGVPTAVDVASTPRAAAPRLSRMILASPGALFRFYMRWVVRANTAVRGVDGVERSWAWARRERSQRSRTHADVMARIDFWTFRILARRSSWLARAALVVLPLWAAVRTRNVVSRMGGKVKVEHGLSLLAQAVEIWLLQLRFPLTFGLQPNLYYRNELYSPSRRADAPFIFSNLHQNTLTRAVNGGRTGFMDKRAFAERCAEHGLPHLPTLFSVDRGGRIDGLGDRPLLPPIDLFSKPTAGGNGAGAARWIREEDRSYRAEDGARMTPDHLLTALRESAERGPILVQPLVRNQDELREIVGETLSTVRFVSVLTRSGSWEPILAIHRSAERDSAVDNTGAGGAAAAIDLRTGRLGRVLVPGSEGGQFFDIHPRTGRRIEGARLPCWDEVFALVRRAHLAFAEHPVVGWDIAITPDGPLLVECNLVWIAGSLQSAHRLALGRHRYAALLLEHLEFQDRAPPGGTKTERAAGGAGS